MARILDDDDIDWDYDEEALAKDDALYEARHGSLADYPPFTYPPSARTKILKACPARIRLSGVSDEQVMALVTDIANTSLWKRDNDPYVPSASVMRKVFEYIDNHCYILLMELRGIGAHGYAILEDILATHHPGTMRVNDFLKQLEQYHKALTRGGAQLKHPGDHPRLEYLVQGIVNLSEFDQKLGKARIHNSLIVQHSCSWPEVENQLNST